MPKIAAPKHIHPFQNQRVAHNMRLRLLGQKRNYVLWLTGLSGSGKSTIAHQLEERLYQQGVLSIVLDGDLIRSGLNSDLGFSVADRNENIRRVTELAYILYKTGIFVIVSFISPFAAVRKKARKKIGKDFIEIFVDCPLEICEERDPKTLYKKARSGKIKNFTGIDQAFEVPKKPEIHLQTDKELAETSVRKIMDYLSTI